MFRKTFFILLFFIGVLTFNSLNLYAPPSAPGGGSTPGCWPPPCIPIDGASTLLIAIGFAYGAKEVVRSNKKRKK